MLTEGEGCAKGFDLGFEGNRHTVIIMSPGSRSRAGNTIRWMPDCPRTLFGGEV